jgi:hypothetical protein
VVALFDPAIHLAAKMVDREVRYNGSAAESKLGIQYMPMHKSIIDCGHSIVAVGLVKKPAKYVAPPAS